MILSPPPRNRPRRAIKGSPELVKPSRNFPHALTDPPVVVERPEGSSSSSPANTAAATVSTTPAPPGPPPLHSLHQKLSLPPVSPSPCSILIGSHRSPKPTLLPNASSTAKLAAGGSLCPRRPNDHREDRHGLADPSRPSGAHGEPPFAGVDRRCLASVRAEEEEGEMDWSNLTSGPLGPTVRDPAPPPRV